MARTGEMMYAPGEVPEELGVGRDGKITITRSPEEVFNPRSMASLNGKPVTDDHPPVDVDPQNWRFYTRGVVVNPRRGEDIGLRDCLIADLIIFDEELIKDIEGGKNEVSAGYNPEYFQIMDAQGEPIHGRGEQSNILYNHLAVVKNGRCGSRCAIQDHKTVQDDSAFWSRRRARKLKQLARISLKSRNSANGL